MRVQLPRSAAVLVSTLFSAAASTTPARAYEPADAGHLTLHLKAESLAPGANNSPVAAWGPFTAGGTAQPTFLEADTRFNNKPVVRFDGSSDSMTFAGAELNARTIIAVTTLEAGATSLATLLSNGADGLDIRRQNSTAFYRSPGQGLLTSDFVGNGTPQGTLTVNGVPSGAITPAVPHLMIATAGGLKNYSTIWLSGTTVGTAVSRFWRGSVAEVLIYDEAPTPEHLGRLAYYFQTKYGLPTTAPAPTPFVRTFTAGTAAGVTSPAGILSSSGSPVTLTWNVEDAATVAIDGGVLAPSAQAAGAVTVNPTVTTTYTLTAENAAGPMTRAVTVHVGLTPAPPRINEFLADNADGLTDEDGALEDWIEIFNPNPYAIDLNGYALRDSADTWAFPAGSGIAAGGCRVVFASGKNRIDPAKSLHTNFKLNNAGEYLGLIRQADATAVSEFAPVFPAQFSDASYGWWSDPPRLGYFGTPTGAPSPGIADNGTGVLGFLDRSDDTRFSVKRGFFTEAFTTVVSVQTPGAKLVYTTNGSPPSLTNGIVVEPANAETPPSIRLTIHPGAVPVGAEGVNLASVGGVTTLRAAAFKEGFSPTNIDTQTYLFPENILKQTPANATARGWPVGAVNGQVFNYGMDANVVNSFTPREMTDSLQAIPTLSVVTASANLTNSATGVYVNADQHGSAWERPISLELIRPPGYIDPDGNADGFQIDGGIRIRGGYSRNDGFFKHGLRLFFSKKYDGKLRYPMFGAEGTNEFGKLDLGTGSNYGWYRESDFNQGKFNTMCRDMFCRDTQGALGQPYTKSRFYHLYLNGVYWGVYYTEERAEAEFAASYMGGDDKEYDAVKCGNHIASFATEATDGDMVAWRSLWDKTRSIGTAGATLAKYFEIQGRNPDGTRNPALPVLLDVDNLIDEMLVIFYAGDGDAVLSNFLGHDKPNNWFSVYRRGGEEGFRFFIRDGEHTLGTPNWVVDQTGPWVGSLANDFTYSNPQRIHQDLMASPEYKLRFADHARRHFFNDGALTPAKCIARFQRRADQVRGAIKVESARWGDAQSLSGVPAGHPPRYVEADWISAVQYVTNSIMPNRSTVVQNQLRVDGLYPALAAPVFADDATGSEKHGGDIASGFNLRMTSAAGVIHYTLDGTDPRVPGGAVSAGAALYSAPVPLAAGTLVQARTLSGVTWSALSSAFFSSDTVPASAANLVVSQLSYNPSGTGNAEEFIELMNISARSVDLTGVHLRLAADFDFADHVILPPGGRMQIVGDAAVFQTLHGAAPGVRIAGQMLGNLSNSGEAVQVVSDTQGVIKAFTYDNDAPWPTEADTDGYRLVLIRPETNPDHTNPLNWRGSAAQGNAPVAEVPAVFAGNAEADSDGDGLNAWLEYALGTSDSSAASGPEALEIGLETLSSETGDNQFLTVTFSRAAVADDAEVTVELSDGLGAWVSGPAHLVPLFRERPSATEVRESWRAALPVTESPRRFARLRVRSR